MNSYLELKKKHQEEVNNFPMMFAFSNEQFDEGMKEFGLEPTATDKICSIGAGGFCKKTDAESLHNMFERHDKEMKQAIDDDKTGEGFIYEMFYYELSNHEYTYTWNVEDAINSVGLTIDEVNNNKRLLKGLRKACKDQKKWDEEVNG